ncbi:MAG: pyruvate:ferredoxin (flavodoxin) oxidoreductase, partial [Clostridia bacterium]|nr:pyruvate:ferredoxin (flavodoxin) oxidoreductase [Clostridia bacterium]
IEETVDYINAHGGKVGLIKVRLYRPFVKAKLLEAIPETVTKIAVMDRTKEPGAGAEPLFLDVVNAVRGTKFESALIIGGRYGLGSKDTTPACIFAVYKNLDAEKPIDGFTVGINDDVTNLSLPLETAPNTAGEGIVSCKFWGLGSDGTVGANKNSIKIIGDHTDKYIQAYFAYDSKKSGGITISHLRFGDTPIRSTYYVSHANFVACHNPSYIERYDITGDIVEGGTFLLNCQWTPEELEAKLPAKVKRDLANKKVNFYTIDAISIAREIGLGNRTNTVLQSAFFSLANIIPSAEAIDYMKKAAYKSFAKKGEDIVNMNYAAIDAGANAYTKIEVPAEWANAVDADAKNDKLEGREEVVKFVKEILEPTNAQKGDDLPVSIFHENADGTFPQGTAAYEKRGVAVDVPDWDPTKKCAQCNQCSYVCPHAAIRPIAMTDAEAAEHPEFKLVPMTGMPGYKFGVTVSALDCLGCGSCVEICPMPDKPLKMAPIEGQLKYQDAFDATYEFCDNADVLAKFKPETVKGSQFKQPLLEFSGACAGCGETPYAKLITQLFGDRMFIANATGCSSIWGGSAPSMPYTVNKQGHGPAWANSLFEDNAEFGIGMATAMNARRARLAETVAKIAEADCASDEIKSAANEWLAGMDNAEASKVAGEKLLAACKASACNCDLSKEVVDNADLLTKKSMWIFGGDGWAYDIGFGGLDHALASGEDVNIFVFDTEVYSNTGGQASKSTPTGSTAKFAAAGKAVKKKDLAAIAMSYGYVYVAQIAMGADYNQCIKAITEAEKYKGPSLIIAYAPCINHGIKKGLGTSMLETKAAVASGYWFNFRFNPELAAEGKNPFVLDSKEPTKSYKDFIKTETRYSSLEKAFPERASVLFDTAEQQAKEKYAALKKKAEM